MSMIIGLVGISGVGKTYMKQKVIETYNVCQSLVAITTREQRKNEVNGVDKYFLTEKEFEEKIESIDIVTKMYGASYGFWKQDLCRNGVQIVELYYKDISKMKKCNTITILITTSNSKKVFSILLQRYGFSNKLIKRIWEDWWIRIYLRFNKRMFDYIVENDYTEKSINNLKKIIESLIHN